MDLIKLNPPRPHKTSRYLILAAILAFEFVAYVVAAKEAPKKPREVVYTLQAIDAEMWSIVDINNKGEVLIERQLVRQAAAVPILIRKNGKETRPFECPGTINDTTGEAINNRAEIVGYCGQQPGVPAVFGFVASPKKGSFDLLAYPGAWATFGYGINDRGQVVGFYINQSSLPASQRYHSFLWDKASNEYRTIDNPLAELTGGWTWLKGINNKGQIVGHYNTALNVPWQEYQFIYDNGTFTPIAYPGAAQTHITGLNNHSQILGWYDGGDCLHICLFLYDAGDYVKIELPLPPHQPLPDGTPAGNATVGGAGLGGLNDKGQFVGTYTRITEWAYNQFGELGPSGLERVYFVATPKKRKK